jgi:hypothetical protein
MISSAQVVRRIVAAPAPVLLPDTCAVLDLARDPTRGKFSADHVLAAKDILDHANAKPQRIWISITKQVIDEKGEHQIKVKEEAETEIRKLEERIHRVQRIMAAHGLSTTAISPGLVASNFPDVANRMADAYFAAGLQVRSPRNVAQAAYARIAANRAPSRRGQQARDCYVIESYLALARNLREAGFKLSMVFLMCVFTGKRSAQRADYGLPNYRVADECYPYCCLRLSVKFDSLSANS